MRPAASSLTARKRRPTIGDEVHDDDRVQLHREHAHGHAAEGLGFLVHLVRLGLVRLKDLQGREALEILKETVAKLGVLLPIRRKQAAGDGLHRRDGDGNKRHARDEARRNRKGDGRDADKKGDGRQKRIEELRQVEAKVRLDLLDALARHLYDLGCGNLLRIGGSQAEHLVVERAAQRLLNTARGEIPHMRRGARGCKAHGKAARGTHDRRQGEGDRDASLEQGIHHQRHACDQGDVGHERHPLQRHLRSHIAHGRAPHLYQTAVDHPNVSPPADPGM